MPGLRNLVRALVGAALGVALGACAVLPVPKDLPAIALEQGALYRLEVAMAVFYGCLLMVTPAYSGSAIGRLPIEISTRGARFAEEAERSAERDEAAARELEHTANRLREKLAMAISEIDRLKANEGDKT
jgi:hypothetical protein